MHWDLILIIGLALIVLSLHQKVSNLEAQLSEANKHLKGLVDLAKQIEHHTECYFSTPVRAS